MRVLQIEGIFIHYYSRAAAAYQQRLRFLTGLGALAGEPLRQWSVVRARSGVAPDCAPEGCPGGCGPQ